MLLCFFGVTGTRTAIKHGGVKNNLKGGHHLKIGLVTIRRVSQIRKGRSPSRIDLHVRSQVRSNYKSHDNSIALLKNFPPGNNGAQGALQAVKDLDNNCTYRALLRMMKMARPSAPPTWRSSRTPPAPPRAARWGTPRQVTLKPRATLATHSAGFPPAPPRSTERARKP